MKTQEKANLMWRHKGMQVRELIENIILQTPGLTAYQIAKEINLSPAGIKHHLDILEKNGIVFKKIFLLGNKGKVSYYIQQKAPKKFLLENISETNWQANQRLYVYIKKHNMFMITSKISKIHDESCIIRLSLHLFKNSQEYFIIFPDNILEFYDIFKKENHAEHSLSLHPYPELMVVFPGPYSEKVIIN